MDGGGIDAIWAAMHGRGGDGWAAAKPLLAGKGAAKDGGDLDTLGSQGWLRR